MSRCNCSDYRSLHRFSIEDPERFWPELVADLRLEFSRSWQRVKDDSDGPEWCRWFVGGRLNIARLCVHRWRDHAGDAIVWYGEDGGRRALSWRELSDEVHRVASGLASLGVAAGDAVGIFLPMSPEAVIASHACAHLGAMQVPLFSGFAAPAIATRLADADAKVLISADGSLRRGRSIPMREIAEKAMRDSKVERLVIWRRLGNNLVPAKGGELWWDELGGKLSEPAEVESEHPYLLVYTSGTTGRPKGVLHVQGGFLVSIAREVAYQTDVREGDRVHFVSDMGWLMGPWTVVGCGSLRATIVLTEGAADWPEDRLWRLIEAERVTLLGVSPTLVRTLMSKADSDADVSSLRAVCTTGEPWNESPYRWLFERTNAPIINISGGTEVGASFLTTVISEPIKPVAVGYPALGQDMDVVDAEGNSIRAEVGELVCRQPWPGMTRGLWRDDERYLETYWRRIPGVWTHGDWASVDEDGYWFLHGRSDETLNIAGKRIGPAELESAAVSHHAVAEAAAIGVPHAIKGEVAWLFCVPVPGTEIEPAAVADAVVEMLGKAFAPARIVTVPVLPKTRSAKVVRRAVRAVALGADPGDLSSLENPEALAEIAHALSTAEGAP
jgi:acetyl-CoA synthetase